MGDDDPYTLAVEQFVWWATQGLSNAAMLAAVGLDSRGADDDDTIEALAAAHRQLQRRLAA